MDLPMVKAAVKAWEKSFKARHGRDPRKEDIKQDPSGIAEQYSLYRFLSKAGASSQQQASSSSASLPSRRSPDAARVTPRTIPALQYPTTPTPPPRRASVQSRTSGTDEAPRKLKRTASKAALAPSSPASSTRPSFVTPKKPKVTGYSGPVYDSNPVNPFAISPAKVSGPAGVSAAASQAGPSTSPFIHATSPRKLKEVLQLNSLKKVRERDGIGSPLKAITPRTRARKRLKGEVVDDTPMKDRLPRRKRGEGKDGSVVEVQEEEELGPSPLRPIHGGRKAFASLLEEAEPTNGSKGKAKETGKRGRPSEMLGLFGRVAKVKEKPPTRGPTTPPTDYSPPITTIIGRSVPLSPDAPPDNPPDNAEPVGDDASSEQLSTPPPDPILEAAASHVSPPKSAQPIRTLSLSDDEEDEWDPEGGRARRTVVIVPTRRPARPAPNDDEIITYNDEESDNDARVMEDEEENVGEVDDEHGEDEEVTPVPPLAEGTTATSTTYPSSPPTTVLAPPLLSLLSLHSPSARSKQSRLSDLRVKAIFNPTDAARLVAMKRGQDVYVPGEGGEETEEERVMDAYEMGEEDGPGDDDWESENEGWKRSGVEVDDVDW